MSSLTSGNSHTQARPFHRLNPGALMLQYPIRWRSGSTVESGKMGASANLSANWGATDNMKPCRAGCSTQNEVKLGDAGGTLVGWEKSVVDIVKEADAERKELSGW